LASGAANTTKSVLLADIADLGLGLSHLQIEEQDGRRRQSSNFFDILNDPLKY
jgi:hypothetical protein